MSVTGSFFLVGHSSEPTKSEPLRPPWKPPAGNLRIISTKLIDLADIALDVVRHGGNNRSVVERVV
jgi:hypothetical protein